MNCFKAAPQTAPGLVNSYAAPHQWRKDVVGPKVEWDTVVLGHLLLVLFQPRQLILGFLQLCFAQAEGCAVIICPGAGSPTCRQAGSSGMNPPK